MFSVAPGREYALPFTETAAVISERVGDAAFIQFQRKNDRAFTHRPDAKCSYYLKKTSIYIILCPECAHSESRHADGALPLPLLRARGPAVRPSS